MAKKLKRLGIYGGSFNPIHIGHLIIADRAIEALKLDKLILVPSAETPGKDPKTLVPPEHRLRITKLAVGNSKKMEVSNIEVVRGGKTFTVDTVETLRSQAHQTFLIMGTDSYNSLPKWHRIGDLAKMVKFAVAGRPGCEIKRNKYKKIDISVPLINISATEIRERLYLDMTVRHLVPDVAVNYIKFHKLYGCS